MGLSGLDRCWTWPQAAPAAQRGQDQPKSDHVDGPPAGRPDRAGALPLMRLFHFPRKDIGTPACTFTPAPSSWSSTNLATSRCRRRRFSALPGHQPQAPEIQHHPDHQHRHRGLGWRLRRRHCGCRDARPVAAPRRRHCAAETSPDWPENTDRAHLPGLSRRVRGRPQPAPDLLLTSLPQRTRRPRRLGPRRRARPPPRRTPHPRLQPGHAPPRDHGSRPRRHPRLPPTADKRLPSSPCWPPPQLPAPPSPRPAPTSSLYAAPNHG